MYLDGDDLCHFKAADVRGKVVISLAHKYDCGTIAVYRSLATAGAAAFVKDIYPKPPGFTTFAWDYVGRPKTALSPALLIEVSYQDVNLKDIDQALVRIGPPHNNEYADEYNSLYWIIFLRILTPMWAFWITMVAITEAWRLRCLIYVGRSTQSTARTDTQEVGLWVCLIEGGCAFLLGVVYACGQMGRNALPEWYHNWFWTVFQGQSLVSSGLLLVLLWERLRSIQPDKPPSRPFWATYRTRRWLGGIICCGMDLSGGLLRNAYLDHATGVAQIYALVAVLTVIVSGAIGFMFAKAAVEVSRPLRTLQQNHPNNNFDQGQTMDRIVEVLAMNGVMGFVMTIGIAWWFYEIANGMHNELCAIRVSIIQWFTITVRLAVAYWHLQAIRPALASSSFTFFVSELRRMCPNRGWRFAIAPASSISVEFSDESLSWSEQSGGCLFEIEDVGHSISSL